MQATQSGTEKQLARTAVSLQNSMAAVASLEKDLSTAGEKFTFLQDMRAYIADLCDMLQVCTCFSSSATIHASSCSKKSAYLYIYAEGCKSVKRQQNGQGNIKLAWSIRGTNTGVSSKPRGQQEV